MVIYFFDCFLGEKSIYKVSACFFKIANLKILPVTLFKDLVAAFRKLHMALHSESHLWFWTLFPKPPMTWTRKKIVQKERRKAETEIVIRLLCLSYRPAMQPMSPDGPVRQPYATVNFSPLSEIINCASDCAGMPCWGSSPVSQHPEGKTFLFPYPKIHNRRINLFFLIRKGFNGLTYLKILWWCFYKLKKM